MMIMLLVYALLRRRRLTRPSREMQRIHAQVISDKLAREARARHAAHNESRAKWEHYWFVQGWEHACGRPHYPPRDADEYGVYVRGFYAAYDAIFAQLASRRNNEELRVEDVSN